MGRAHIDLDRPASVRELIERVSGGEEVFLEHEGVVVALVSPVPPAKGWLAALFEERRNAEPLDEDWERDMAKVGELFNRPVEPTPWE